MRRMRKTQSGSCSKRPLRKGSRLTECDPSIRFHSAERSVIGTVAISEKPKVYDTGHHHSKVLCRAFAEGCKGSLVPPNGLLDGPAVVYGILRGCGEIIKQCEWINRDYYHIDHGYFLRGHYRGYYRITRNGLQCHGYGVFPSSRWESLHYPMKTWRREGRSVVICPISPMVCEFRGIDGEKWLEAVISEVSGYTDRPIIVKRKDGSSLSEALKDAWCLVTHTSNAAVDAIVSGIPAIVLGPSACRPVSWTWENIESPVWPDREEWAHCLAWNQFTIEEMKSGFAWECLK